MSRIIRTKFLYRAAINELDSGHPFAAGMAISLLQDAVEAMAHEAAASVNVPLPARSNFLDHWDAVAKSSSGNQLPYKIEMTELNAARVAFKHLGVNPALSEAEKQRLSAHRFLVETAQAFFKLTSTRSPRPTLLPTPKFNRRSGGRSRVGGLRSDEILGVLSCRPGRGRGTREKCGDRRGDRSLRPKNPARSPRASGRCRTVGEPSI